MEYSSNVNESVMHSNQSQSNTEGKKSSQLVPECINCGIQSKQETLSLQLEFIDQHFLVCPRRFPCDYCEKRFKSIV